MTVGSDRLDFEDRQARLAAQTVFDRPLVLEAGAGTGKTAALVARIAAWCMGPGWQLHQREDLDEGSIASLVMERITAITFTEAAAAEMAERLAAALLQLEGGDLPRGFEAAAFPPDGPERRRRARTLLIGLDRLRVGTIHAFCRRLLAGYPLEAGVHPRFIVDADQLAVAAAAEGLVQDWVRRGAGQGRLDPDLVRLYEHGVEPEELVKLLTFLVNAGVPPDALAKPLEKPEAVASLAGRLASRLSELVSAVGELPPGRRHLEKAYEVVLAAQLGLKRLQASATTAWTLAELQEALAEAASEGVLERLRKWSRKGFSKTEADALDARVADVAAVSQVLLGLLDHVAKLQPERLEVVRKVAGPLLDRLKAELHRRGTLTFQDLLAEACRLLAANPAVRGRERSSLDQVLLDEVQDTDPLQYSLVAWLALDGPRDSRPGLFLVGDPKQSIYGWRGADLAAYEKFVDRLTGQEGGVLHRLSRNFRSVPAILAAVEQRIGPSMAYDPGVQPAFQPLLAHREAGQPAWGEARSPVEVWVSWGWDAEEDVPRAVTTDVAVEMESAAIARDIRELHDRFGIGWGDVALLFRTGSRMDRYLRALQQVGIPASAERDREFYRRREVVEVAALVRCLLDPADTLALVAFLRSAWVGVPDGALVPLWREGLPDLMTSLQGADAAGLERLDELIGRAAEAVPQDIPGLDRIRGWEAGARHALRAVSRLRSIAASQPLDVMVEALRATVLPESTEAARYLGSRRVECLERFFRWLLAAEQQVGGNRPALLRLLRLARVDELPVTVGGSRAGGADAVQLLTIHKAKGLDFPVVYLVEQQAKGKGGEGELAAELVEGGWEFRLLGSATPGWDLVSQRRTRVEDAERVRTLYVAATRPRDRLVLAGHWPRKGEPESMEQARSHADLVALGWQKEDLDLDGLMREARSSGGRVVAMGESWLFPALVSQDESAPGAGELAAGLNLPGMAGQAAGLARGREAAAQRMSRPWRGTVTGETHPAVGDLVHLEPRAGPAAGRDLPAAVGTAIHAALEVFPLDGDADEARRRAAEHLESVVAAEAPPTLRREAVASALELWERFSQGDLYSRFVALRPCVIGRETPLLLPPCEAGPVGVVAGTVDLIYLDPETGELVVADFKTDRVAGEAELQARGSRYRDQLRAYAGALASALGLCSLPRMELWFLSADRVVELPAD